MHEKEIPSARLSAKNAGGGVYLRDTTVWEHLCCEPMELQCSCSGVGEPENEAMITEQLKFCLSVCSLQRTYHALFFL